ncbi:MAG: efflux RND transporter permease subunit [Alphaproteobacteria bacterium]|nr:MAG: efflux RND transporter permease subunit [Alphaproteobacteria bacterium]
MSLPELCIKRPVLATVMNLVLIVLGLIAYQRLSLREYPNTDATVITVETTYRGAAPEIMESQIGKVLEDSLAGVEGLDIMTSVSRQERSQITLTFRLGRDSDAAAADVRDRVSRVRGQLPTQIDEPIIAKTEADAQPIIYLSFSSNRHTPLEITDFADRVVADRLKALPGVAQVRIFGERRQAMRIWLDRDRLQAFHLTPSDVEAALRRQNLDVPAGRLEGPDRELTLSGSTRLSTPQEFADIVLRAEKGYLVRLADVARIEVAAADDRTHVRYNGRPAVALGVVKQSIGNPIEVAKALYGVFPSLRSQLPEGMEVGIAYDSSVFIERSIESVWHTIIEAVIFVVLVIFLFLRSLRATLIPIITIPICLTAGFAIMSLLGFSINTLTLLSLVMAVGLVVDDAIVMLENIQRHIEEGETPFQAAFKGSREIVMAIVAMSITLAAVYAPVAFAGGKTGRLFTEFALTLAGMVLVSGVVALTLSPMMCARLLRRHPHLDAGHDTQGKPPGILARTDNYLGGLLDNLTASYRRSLADVLDRRRWVVLGLLLVLVLGGVMVKILPQELAPAEDRSLFMGIAIAPEGASLDFLDGYTRQMEAMYDKIPEQIRYFMVVGFPVVNQAISFIGLQPWEDRKRPVQAIIGQMFGQFMSMPGVLAFPINPPPLGSGPGQQPVQFVVQTGASWTELNGMMGQLMAKAGESKLFSNMDTDLKLTKPELRFTINRDKAALMGLDVATIGDALETLFGGRKVTRYSANAQEYDVILQVGADGRREPQDLSSIFVRAPGGSMVQLASLVTSEERAAPKELNHFNKLRAATLTAGLAEGVSLGQALDFLDKTARQVIGTDKASFDLAGISRDFREASGTLAFTFGLALIFIFLVLAAQYESWLDPFIIMLSVPLAIVGALFVLWLVGGTMNVYSQIGLVTLIGLIAKHGILIVEFANQRRLTLGESAHDAVREAAAIRLRPILMTTAATILGAMPLALASGAGAEGRQQIGWTVVGGMGFGTMLTLFVVPVAYTWLSRRMPTTPDAIHE